MTPLDRLARNDSAADPAPAGRALRAAYFNRVPNVGDMVTPLVLAAVTGCPARHVADRSKPHILSVGSVMAWATPASQIWGAGVIDPEGGTGRARKRNVHAVRGPLSHRAIRRDGLALGDVPFGDPGFLAPALLGVGRPDSPWRPVGLVCHYLDRDHPTLRRMMTEPGVADLDVREAPEVFLARMAGCAAVVSTSLHGLIFAEALGIPNLWVKAGDRLIGGEFKFADWFATTARPQSRPHVLASGDTALALGARAELRESLIDRRALTAAFPFHALEELQAEQAAWETDAEPSGPGVLGRARGMMAKLANRVRSR
jgi:pyruvyltransferase